MSHISLLVLVIAIVIVLIAIAVIASLTRRSRLRPLSDGSKSRYRGDWSAIEARFIDDPSTAVSEADRLAVAILTERRAELGDSRHMPGDLREAREAARSDEGTSGTEGKRKAMVHYKRIVDESTGGAERADETRRREVA